MMMNDGDLYACTSFVRHIYYIKYIGTHNTHVDIPTVVYAPRQPCTDSRLIIIV